MKIKELSLLKTINSLGLLSFVFLATFSAHAKTISIVAFGDSLMAGYQLAQNDAFPMKLAEAMTKKGYDITMTNASVSGDTTSGGLSRLDWSIPDGTDAVILELGANDALRGLPVNTTRENLNKMAERLRERGINFIIMGMLAPPNMGTEYETAFNAIYPELAKTYDAELYPFFLDGVAGIKELNISDGIHPNPNGIAVMVENISPIFEGFLTKISTKQ
jgi:acyl-CoA thioesterase-1